MRRQEDDFKKSYKKLRRQEFFLEEIVPWIITLVTSAVVSFAATLFFRLLFSAAG